MISLENVFNKGDLKNGLWISVNGYKGNPAESIASQVFIEEHNGFLRVHVWDGINQSPNTTEIDPDTGGKWNVR